MMENSEMQSGRMRRTVNDLVMAEMFLVQATIESATAIGDGINELGKQVSQNVGDQERSWDSISGVLQRTADEALEPYTTRFRYLRDMLSYKD